MKFVFREQGPTGLACTLLKANSEVQKSIEIDILGLIKLESFIGKLEMMGSKKCLHVGSRFLNSQTN
jgi:hypothetical protein